MYTRPRTRSLSGQMRRVGEAASRYMGPSTLVLMRPYAAYSFIFRPKSHFPRTSVHTIKSNRQDVETGSPHR